MEELSVNGTQLAVERHGGAGPPLVLVHGSWVDHHAWDALVPELAPAFEVLTYDRRGHGASARPTGPGSVREDAADLAALLERTGCAPAHVVGNSFGGNVALRLASERPQLLRSLSVHEPPLFELLAHERPPQASLTTLQQHLGEVLERLHAGDAVSGARHFVETLALGPGAWEALPEPLRRTFVQNASTFLDETQDPEALTADLRALARFPRPVLLTRGGQSPPHFANALVPLARALPLTVQHVFVDAGHLPHHTHPAAYARVLRAFVIGVDLAAGRSRETASHPAH